MRVLSLATALVLSATPALAQEEAPGGLLDPHAGLMAWTLIIFAVLFFVLARYAFGPITQAVAQREEALQNAIDQAKRDREEAAKLLSEHRAQLEGARSEAQRIISEGRAVGEKLRAEMIEQTRGEQQELLERARREIGAEREKAIAQIRTEAVDLAIAGASKVIEKNLDDQTNRKLVDSFLASAPTRRN